MVAGMASRLIRQCQDKMRRKHSNITEMLLKRALNTIQTTHGQVCYVAYVNRVDTDQPVFPQFDRDLHRYMFTMY